MAKKKHGQSGNPAKQHHHHATKYKTKVKPVSWLAGARLRTLPIAIAPVLAGAGVAYRAHHFSWTLSLLALAVALFLQIGVNYANDFSDGIRGTDANRVGPGRLVGSGLKRPKQVLAAALIFFGLAAAAGLAITIITQIWWLIAVGIIAIIAAWFYTGGMKPYGYIGLGEVAVFVFFGLVATEGTTFIQTQAFSRWALAGGIAIGLLACAVLMINNIRDIDTDRESGKKTLAVRMGKRASIVVFCLMLALPLIGVGALGILFAGMLYLQFLWILFIPAGVIAIWAKTPAEYILVLKITTAATLVFGAAFGLLVAEPWVPFIA